MNLIEQLKRVIAASATLGILRRDQHVVMRNVSQWGCLIDTDRGFEVGAIGELRIELGGVEYSDLVRVARCESSESDAAIYHVGVEFIWDDAPGEQSLRRLIQSSRTSAPRTHRAHFSQVPRRRPGGHQIW